MLETPVRDFNMAAGNQWKHLEFTLALLKRFFSLLNLKTFAYALLTTYWLLRTRKCMSVHVTCFPETMPMLRIVKNRVLFLNKAVYRAKHRPVDICLKMTFTCMMKVKTLIFF